MAITIGGTYRDGIVTPDRLPEGVREARVEIRFEEAPKPASPVEDRGPRIWFGMFRKEGQPSIPWEAFEEAKKIWEPR